MGTVVSVAADGVDEADVDAFFARIGELEGLLSRYRPDSEISRIGAGSLHPDDADRAVREVLVRCDDLRRRTNGDFDHLPAPGTLDVNALAKGWITEEAALLLRRPGAEVLVNAGGDVLATRRPADRPWRIGIQHPQVRTAVLGTFEIDAGAVATSGAYERGDHIRTVGGLTSVTVVGPDLGEADALSTAAFAGGDHRPGWWADVDPRYGLLTLDVAGRLRWAAPAVDQGIRWCWPETSEPRAVAS
ncbi:MAG: thiamine biosynthesis protein [Actinomycetia bacterium]|nr:thiamine biosynthesis protein [Actinomycetes bacterium]